MTSHRAAALALALVLHTGCATFDRLPEGGEVTPARTGLRIKLEVADITYEEVIRTDSWHARTPKTNPRRLLDVIEKTGWFEAIGPAVQDTPLVAGLTVRRLRESNARLLPSFLTLYLLPSVLDDSVRVDGFITDGTPLRQAKCLREDTITSWHQLFLAVVYPFKAPAQLENRLSEQLALQCMGDLLEQLARAEEQAKAAQ